jgi:methyl-accepting chemotaxis protein
MTSQSIRDQPFPDLGHHPSRPDGKWLARLLRAAERNKVLLIFCLLALIAVVVDVKFVFDVSSQMTKAGDVRVGNPVSEPLITIPVYAEILDYVQHRISLLVGVMVFCLGCMIYLYVHQIHRPLRQVIRAAKEMSNGNLSSPIRSQSRNEVRELAEVINDMAANYQEVLLLTGTAVGKSSSAVEKIEEMLDQAGQEELQVQLGVIKRDLEMLGSVVKDFKFYQTHFDGRKVVHNEREARLKKR